MLDIEKLTQQIIEFYEKISSWEHAVVKGSGLTPAQMHTIEIVGSKKKIRMKELAEVMGVTTGTLTVGVDKLEKKGFLVRQPHEKDRRSYLIVLTDKGERYYREHHGFHVKLTQDIVAPLSEAEREMFSSILDKIDTHI